MERRSGWRRRRQTAVNVNHQLDDEKDGADVVDRLPGYLVPLELHRVRVDRFLDDNGDKVEQDQEGHKLLAAPVLVEPLDLLPVR